MYTPKNGKCTSHTPLLITAITYYSLLLSCFPATATLEWLMWPPMNKFNVNQWWHNPQLVRKPHQWDTNSWLVAHSWLKEPLALCLSFQNLNQQCSHENDRAWAAAALVPIYLCQAKGLTHILFLYPFLSLCFCHWLKIFTPVFLQWHVMKKRLGNTHMIHQTGLKNSKNTQL